VDLPEYQLKANTLQRRLGDYLLTEEIITPEQLDEAIEYQCIYGGKLGTSLIELGVIEEERLAQILSQQLKLHYIKPDLLMNVPNSILKIIPRKLALQYQVVPYHKDKGKLFVAMKDTSNLSAIDELSFQLDHIIIPLAIPEMRLMLALKQHYGMDLTPRFENLESQLKYRKLAADKVAAKKQKKMEQPVPEEEEAAWPLLGDENYEGEEANDDAYFDFGTSPKEMSQTSLGQQLIAASDRNDIARSLINYLSQEFLASGLFMVREAAVTGWLAQHGKIEPTGFDQLSIPLRSQSIFDLIINSKAPFLGSVSDTPQNRRLLEYFDSKPPQTALLLPLLVRDRLVSILYVQDSLEILEKRFAELQNIARKAEMSFTLLILKNKILTT
jgi:hypothetical protein